MDACGPPSARERVCCLVPERVEHVRPFAMLHVPRRKVEFAPGVAATSEHRTHARVDHEAPRHQARPLLPQAVEFAA